LRAVDDEYGRPGDVEGRQPQPMVDPVALDHRAVGIDENPQGKTLPAAIVGHLLGPLADDHQDLGPESGIDRDVGLQLLQLLPAVRSPRAADEHHYGCPRAEHVREANVLAVGGLQREWRGHVADVKACALLRHLSSLATAPAGV
jgi:hypothetical protein